MFILDSGSPFHVCNNINQFVDGVVRCKVLVQSMTMSILLLQQRKYYY